MNKDDLRKMTLGETVEVETEADMAYDAPLKLAQDSLSEVGKLLTALMETHDLTQAKTEYGLLLQKVKQEATDIVRSLQNIPRRS